MFDFLRKKSSAVETALKTILTSAGGGAHKRVDENRELLELLQAEAPLLLKRNPWIVWWLESNDEVFVALARMSKELELQESFRESSVFPRPWPAMEVSASKLESPRADHLQEICTSHPDDVAVDKMAIAMKEKLAKKRAKGFSGWDTTAVSQARMTKMLREHVDKGDPVDVANFCAFLAARGESIGPAEQG